MIYADTSFLVSLYLADVYTDKANRLMADRPRIWLTPLHRAEWMHAVSQHVFRQEVTAREAQRVYRDFERDRRAALWVEVEQPLTAFETCTEMARRHGARLGMRTLDSLHVAAAVDLKAESFWTFDRRQAKLAGAEGLKLLEPV